jgi:uncharacterized protein YjbI with pentapeptide repeats
LVDARLKTSSTLKGYDLINCDVEGVFDDCFFVGTQIKNSQLLKSKLQNSEVENSKILNCKSGW